jgi:hypothetical protein
MPRLELRASLLAGTLFGVLAAQRALRLFVVGELSAGPLWLWTLLLLEVIGATAAAAGLLTEDRVARPGIALFLAAWVLRLGAETFALGIRAPLEALGLAVVGVGATLLAWWSAPR